MRYHKVIILNGTFSNSQHEMIDSSMIMAFTQFAGEVVVFFQKERSQIVKKLIDQQLGSNNIKYQRIRNLSEKKHVTFRELIAAIQECWFFLTKANKNTLTCLTYINRFNGYGLNFLSKITKHPIIMICHGELRLATTKPKSDDSNWIKMMRHFYTQTKINPNVRLAVLGDNIKENIIPFVLERNRGKIISFDHPYFSTTNACLNTLHHPIRIGIIGFLKKDGERGYENVRRFVNLIEDDNDIELRLLGIVEKVIQDELPATVKILNPESLFIPRNKYNKMIEELDYIYCPYPEEAFKYTASGAMLEALSKRRPIIMHNNYYGSYLRRKFGEFGIVVDIKDPTTFKQSLKDNNKYDLLVQKQNEVFSRVSPIFVSNQLKRLCEAI